MEKRIKEEMREEISKSDRNEDEQGTKVSSVYYGLWDSRIVNSGTPTWQQCLF